METLRVGQATRDKFSSKRMASADPIGLLHRFTFKHRAYLLLAVELAIAAISYASAVLILWEGMGRGPVFDLLRVTIGPLILFRLAALVSVRLHRRSLRYASLQDFISIARAVSISSLLFWGFACLQFGSFKIPWAVILVDWAFLQLSWGGLHFSARIFAAHNAAARKSGKRVIIVGAGDAGIMLLKDLAFDSCSACRPVGMVDDDRSKWGRTIYDVPIVGGTADLPRIASETNAEEILICIPSATRAQMRSVLNACRQTKLPVRTLPSLSDLVDGRVSRRDLRVPPLEGLLPRDEVRFDIDETRRIVGGKVVLVTGAGGSIGSELCRQIAQADPQKLLLIDRSENSLFYVNMEVCERLGSDRVKPFLADLLHADRLREILRAERPDIIFHAAAHKHVGMLELHPQEAIRNNILGTRNVARAALECGTKQLINISTDKAVNPRNYMGLSKKVTELCIQELARVAGVRYSNVRFGNVAGSTGSVLRLFADQIDKGGPIRVTDPRATRYFMSVPEAVHLILRAAALGCGGETFVFDMGEPLSIYELAKTMMLFAGLKPHEDIPIEFTGLKEGEKITEELWEEWENPVPTSCDRIFVVRDENAHSHGILKKIEAMEALLAHGDRENLLAYIHGLAPEFRWNQNPVESRPASPAAGAGWNTWGAA